MIEGVIGGTQTDARLGYVSAARLRARTTWLRVAITATIAAMLFVFGDWPWAPLWFVVYAKIQGLAFLLARRFKGDDDSRAVNLFAGLTFASYFVLAVPTWHLWTEVGEIGIAATSLFLTGLSMQLLVQTIGAPRLFLAGAAPLFAFQILVPAFAWGLTRPVDAAIVAFCVFLLQAFLLMMWRANQGMLSRMHIAETLAVEASAEAHATAQAQKRFVAMVSHEMRTPLAAVLAGLEAAQAQGATERRGRDLAIALDGARALRAMVDRVIAHEQSHHRQNKTKPEPLDLVRFAKETARPWQGEAQAKALDFTIETAGVVARFVLADRNALAHVVNALLSNAVKFTDVGGITMSVTAKERAMGRAVVEIAVADTGPGVDPAQAESLFAPFVQGDASLTRRHGGLGLGLSLARDAAEAIGGRLVCDTHYSSGARFVVSFVAEIVDIGLAPAPPAENAVKAQARPTPAGPIVKPAPTPAKADVDASAPAAPVPIVALAAPENAAPPPQSYPSKTALVVDDHAINRRILRALLEPMGFRIVEAEDAGAAITQAKQQAFDLVLMDLHLPGMSGVDAAKMIRGSCPPNRSAPIIAVTANDGASERAACIEAGIGGFVVKPIKVQDLVTEIQAAAKAA